jgi:hypothetical protein
MAHALLSVFEISELHATLALHDTCTIEVIQSTPTHPIAIRLRIKAVSHMQHPVLPHVETRSTCCTQAYNKRFSETFGMARRLHELARMRSRRAYTTEVYVMQLHPLAPKWQDDTSPAIQRDSVQLEHTPHTTSITLKQTKASSNTSLHHDDAILSHPGTPYPGTSREQAHSLRLYLTSTIQGCSTATLGNGEAPLTARLHAIAKTIHDKGAHAEFSCLLAITHGCIAAPDFSAV